MVAFNFKPEFALMILDGAKIQTIRKTRRCEKGKQMQLYTGLRTKQAKLIAEHTCILADYCHLRPDGIVFGNKANHPDCDTFAQWDGFKNYDDMLGWFRRQYGTEFFVGTVHRWKENP